MNGLRIWIDRNHDSTIVTATNISGRKADEGLLAFARELYTQFTVKKQNRDAHSFVNMEFIPYGGGAVMDDGARDVIPNLMQLVAG